MRFLVIPLLAILTLVPDSCDRFVTVPGLPDPPFLSTPTAGPATPTAAPTEMSTETETATPTSTATPTPTSTSTETLTSTPTAVPTATETPTRTPTPPPGVVGVRPWAILQSLIDGLSGGDTVQLTYESDDVSSVLAIQIDGSGSSLYESAASSGAASAVCAAGASNCDPAACPGGYPDACAETSPGCDGPECAPQTGNLVGTTRDALDFMLDNTSASCDTWEEVAVGPDGDGFFSINEDCDPMAGATASYRVIVVLVVDGFGTGSSDPVTIEGFATFWLNGYSGGACQGSTCTFEVRYLGPGSGN